MARELSVEAALLRMAALSPRLAAEAARADQEVRWRAGERVSAERYLEALPQVAASPEDALLVIYGEVLLGGELARFRSLYPHLAEQLDALGEVHQAMANLSQVTPPGPTPPPPVPGIQLGNLLPTEGGPLSIPGYDVLEKVGQGGMGVVYRGRQRTLDRVVALKVVRAGDFVGAEQLARFLTEARALAEVEHLNVVRVHEAGRGETQPFIALEFVSGGSLADRLRQGPLAPGEAARLLEQVARGVQAAHEKGIVHRDLKPANVLLTPDGIPKVTDFGLARRVEAGTDLTQTGAVMGTPSYMAPEQARGDSKRVGPAADVYALGAVLYECLTGRPPFVGPVAMEILMQVVGDEPVAVRALAPKTPRDLETVCHRCLHKDPTRRYASAGDLADDLGRFLRREPVVARPVGVFERGVRWARRRPAVAGLLLLLILGTGSAFWALRAEQLRTAEQRDQAVANLEEARKAVDECFGIAKEDALLQEEHLRKVRKLLLEKTLPFYERFAQQRPSDPKLLARQAEYLFRVAEITAEIGRKADAIQTSHQAAEILEKLRHESPDVPEYQATLGLVYNNLGTFQESAGTREEAQASYERARDLFRTLRQEHAGADSPDPARYARELAGVYTNLANLDSRADRLGDAIANYELARQMREELVRGDPTLLEYQAGLALTLNNLASLERRTGKRPQARKDYERSRDLWEKLVQSNPRSTRYQANLALVCSNLAKWLHEGGNGRDALPYFEKAREIRQRLNQAHPEVTLYQVDFASSLQNLAALQSQQGDREAARKNFLQARSMLRDLTASHPEEVAYQADLAFLCYGLGVLERQMGHRPEALETSRQACDLYQKLAARQPQVVRYKEELAMTWSNLATLHRATGNLQATVQNYREARDLLLELLRTQPGVMRFQLLAAATCNNLSLMQTDLGQPDEAIRTVAQVLPVIHALRERAPNDPTCRAYLRNAHAARARALMAAKRHGEALADWDQIARLDSTPSMQALVRVSRASCLAHAGRPREAMVEADRMGTAGQLSGALCYNLACVASVAAGAVARDPGIPLPLREKQAEAWARQAVELLTRATRVGYFRDSTAFGQFEKDGDLGYLRQREDFHSLALRIGKEVHRGGR